MAALLVLVWVILLKNSVVTDFTAHSRAVYTPKYLAKYSMYVILVIW